jgi:calmodulin
MGRIGALIRSKRAQRAREKTAIAGSGPIGVKKGQRSTTAAALVDLYREYFESLSPQQYAKLYDAFTAHGKTEPGFVTAKELGPLLRALGDDPRPAELRDLIRCSRTLVSQYIPPPALHFLPASFPTQPHPLLRTPITLRSLVDADGNALVDFTEFLTLVAVRSQHPQSEDEILEAFRMFDTEGKGTIPVAVFRQAMVQLCGLSNEEVDAMVVEAREVTRQHVARQRDIEIAKQERRALRRRKPDGPTVGESPVADAVGGALAAAPAPPPPPASATVSPADREAAEVIYYEPLVRILFSF